MTLYSPATSTPRPPRLSAKSRRHALEWLSHTPNPAANTIVMTSIGMQVVQHAFGTHPKTAEDIGWCLLLIAAVPEIATHLDKSAAVSQDWAAIINAWDAISESYTAEVDEPSRPTPFAGTDRLLQSLLRHEGEMHLPAKAAMPDPSPATPA